MDSKRSLRTVSVEFRKKTSRAGSRQILAAFQKRRAEERRKRARKVTMEKSEKRQNIRKSTLRERQKKKESYSTLSKLEKAGRLRSHMAVVQ